MFPGAGASIEYNDAGEVTGWDYPDYDQPYEDYPEYGDYEEYDPTYSLVYEDGEWIVKEHDNDQGDFDSLTDAEIEADRRQQDLLCLPH